MHKPTSFSSSRRVLFSVLALSGAFLAACQSASDAPSGGEAPAPTDPRPAPVTCVPGSGPTFHTGDVEGDEVWTAEASPHVLTGDVNVRDGAKLTIMPCAEIVVAEKKGIRVAFPITPNTGSLVAEGTAERPIRIHGKDGARWSSLFVQAGGTAKLAHVTLENGGGGDFQEGASLVAFGDGVDGADALVSVDHVTIEGSLGSGAYLARGARFMDGSAELVVHGSGSAESPYPLQIEEHALGSVPTGRYTGNRKDEILIDPAGGQKSGTGLLEDATLRNRGVPYHVGRSAGDSLLIGGREDEKLVTLTIEPGVELRFETNAALKVQHFVNDAPSTAAIVAEGTAEAPIVFTSAAEAPQPGDWRGLWFGGIPDAKNRIAHAKIAYAGGDCGCLLLTCSAITEFEGAVIFTAAPKSAFITDTVFANVKGNGITQGFDGAFVDFGAAGNTFDAVSGCPQTLPRLPNGCASPKPACQ